MRYRRSVVNNLFPMTVHAVITDAHKRYVNDE